MPRVFVSARPDDVPRPAHRPVDHVEGASVTIERGEGVADRRPHRLATGPTGSAAQVIGSWLGDPVSAP